MHSPHLCEFHKMCVCERASSVKCFLTFHVATAHRVSQFDMYGPLKVKKSEGSISIEILDPFPRRWCTSPNQRYAPTAEKLRQERSGRLTGFNRYKDVHSQGTDVCDYHWGKSRDRTSTSYTTGQKSGPRINVFPDSKN